MSPNLCTHCGRRVAERLRRGLCNGCYWYQWEHHQPRPLHLIQAAARKEWERRELVKRLRETACCDAVAVVDEHDEVIWSLCELPPHHQSLWHQGWVGRWRWAGMAHADLVLEREDEAS